MPMKRPLPIVFVSLIVLGVVMGVRVIDPLPVLRMRLTVFDAYQRIEPRLYEPAPIRVIDIDNDSLARLGQWPWPRTRIAALVDRLSGLDAAAIAFAVVFAEPDRTSPARVIKDWPQTSEAKKLAETLSRLPDHDSVLASAFSSAPAVLGFLPVRKGKLPPPPTKFGFAYIGGRPAPALERYASAIGNLAPLEKTASGIGSLAIPLDPDGLVRRITLLARVGDRTYPSLGVEALRVAQGATTIVARSSGADGLSPGAESVLSELKVGRYIVPTGPRGEMWLHFTRHVPARVIPAWRIFEADFASFSSEIGGAIVLIGTSASGLQNSKATPLNPAEASVSIHAQALEQMILGRFLERPDWTDGAETLISLALGTLLAFLLAFGLGPIAGGLAGAGAASFYMGRILGGLRPGRIAVRSPVSDAGCRSDLPARQQSAISEQRTGTPSRANGLQPLSGSCRCREAGATSGGSQTGGRNTGIDPDVLRYSRLYHDRRNHDR